MGNQHSALPHSAKVVYLFRSYSEETLNLDSGIKIILSFSFPLPFIPHLHPSIDALPFPFQVLLQQADFAQNQREAFHLQVQLQQGGAGELPHPGYGQLSLLSGPEPLQWELRHTRLQPRGTKVFRKGI